MKKIFLLFFVFYTSIASAQSGNWKLVWHDEFNYSGPPDSAKWVCEGSTRRNKELQLYTNRPKNVYVNGGFLTITALKESLPNPRYVANSSEWYAKNPTMEYTSASINTKNKASWKYGKIEVRGKVPPGRGTWPAVWLLGVDKKNLGWPRQGEMDVMEHQGKDSYRSSGTLHYAAQGTFSHIKTGDNFVNFSKSMSDGFHIYGIEWDSTRVTLFLDRKPFFSYKVDKTMAFGQDPFYLIINLALGGTAGGDVDDAIFPAKFVIDYVRVYQH